MRKLVSVLVLVLVFSVSYKTKAQEIQTIPPGDDVIVSLTNKQPAPFDGQLFDNSTAMRWGFWLQQYKLHLKLDVDKEVQTCGVKLDFKDKELKINQDQSKTITDDLKVRLQRSETSRLASEEAARHPAFWKTFEWGLMVGIVMTGVVVVVSTWGVGLLK